MHIVDVTLFFAPHSGGVKRYLLAKKHFLSQQPGMRHTLVVPGARDHVRDDGIVELGGFPHLRVPGGYRVPFRIDRWSRKLRELAPDVIEAADPYHLPWVVLGVARKLGIPAVAFAHSDLARLFADRFAPSIGRATGIYLRHLYRQFDCVLAPSRLIADRLGELGVNNVAIQPLGVDGAIFHPSRSDPHLRGELGLSRDARLLVFAGRMAREKEIPLLMRALETLGAPYHLLLIGGERRESLAPNVTMLPYEQDQARLARLIASSDVLIHAGRHETFGMILVEAMACGLPVIAVRAGAVTEIVDDEIGRIATPDDVASMADAVRSIFASDRVAMGSLARKRAEDQYLWQNTLPRLVQRYADLALAKARTGTHADAPAGGVRLRETHAFAPAAFALDPDALDATEALSLREEAVRAT